jgi:trimethylamine:corrinoid methyltransferase-like protein
MDSGYIFSVHKTVKWHRPIRWLEAGEKTMTKRLTLKERRELQSRMAKVFNPKIKQLSTELQGILLDDLVTAFQNRINVLIRAQAKRSY